MRYLFLILIVLSCGTPPEEAPKPRVTLRGDYEAAMRPYTREGSCDFLPKEAFGSVTFDEDGNLVPGFPGVDCVTEYDNDLVSLRCKGYGSTLTAQANGVAYHSDGGIRYNSGDGEAHGNVGGCTAITFQFRFWRKP